MSLGPTIAAVPDANTNPNWVHEAWGRFTAEPSNLAMLAQIGVNLLQPVPPGQTVTGHIGQAVGAGLAAKDRGLAAQGEVDRQNAESARQEAELALRGREVASSERLQGAQAKYFEAGGARGAGDQSLRLSRLANAYNHALKQANDPTADEATQKDALDLAQTIKDEIDAITSGTGGAAGTIDPAAVGVTTPPKPSGGYQEGDVVANKNGDKVQLRGGKWVPYP